MVTLEHITSLKEYFQQANSVAVILGSNLSKDQLAGASSLTTGLRSTNKDVGVYAISSLRKSKQITKFRGLDGLQTELGKQNLIVEFDYNPKSVDKVSYHIGEESGKFYLTIKPQKGQKPLDENKVKFSYAGANFDLVILVGVSDLEDLEQLYFGYEELYKNSAIITINRFKTDFSNLHLDHSRQTGVSEAMFEILQGLGIAISADMATELLAGISAASNSFQSLTVTADTFEVVAQLMRLGARRMRRAGRPKQPRRPKKLQKRQGPSGKNSPEQLKTTKSS